MASKIKDGMFLGDQYIAADIDFIVANKVTHIINCAAGEVRNCWERIGIKYLNFAWDKTGERKLFDSGNIALQQLVSFVKSAHFEGESVLFHSVDGVDRASTCVIAYFMFNYEWGLDKVMDFLRSKRTDIRPCPVLVKQLFSLDHKLGRELKEKVSHLPNHLVDRKRLTWDLEHTKANHPLPVGNDLEYGGSRMKQSSTKQSKTRLTWIDDTPGKSDALCELAQGPFRKGPLPIRPPGPSYRSLQAGPGWVDEYKIMDNRYSGDVESGARSPIPGRDHQPRSILKRPKSDETMNKTADAVSGTATSNVARQMSGWTAQEESATIESKRESLRNPGNDGSSKQEDMLSSMTDSLGQFRVQSMGNQEGDDCRTMEPPTLTNIFQKTTKLNSNNKSLTTNLENNHAQPRAAGIQRNEALQHDEESKCDSGEEFDEMGTVLTQNDNVTSIRTTQPLKEHSSYRASLEQRLFSRATNETKTPPSSKHVSSQLQQLARSTPQNRSNDDFREEQTSFSTSTFKRSVSQGSKLSHSASLTSFSRVDTPPTSEFMKASFRGTGANLGNDTHLAHPKRMFTKGSSNSQSCPSLHRPTSTSQGVDDRDFEENHENTFVQHKHDATQWDVRQGHKFGNSNTTSSLSMENNSLTRRQRGRGRRNRPRSRDSMSPNHVSRRSYGRSSRRNSSRTSSSSRDSQSQLAMSQLYSSGPRHTTKPGTTVMRLPSGTTKQLSNSGVFVSHGRPKEGFEVHSFDQSKRNRQSFRNNKNAAHQRHGGKVLASASTQGERHSRDGLDPTATNVFARQVADARGGSGLGQTSNRLHSSSSRTRPSSALSGGLVETALHHRRPLSSSGRIMKHHSEMRNVLGSRFEDHRGNSNVDIKPRWR